MTREEATKWLKLLYASPHIYGEHLEALGMAIEALQAKTDGDLISRQSALAEFKDGRDVYDIMESIEELPSVEPPYQYSKAYVEQIRGERDILQDMVDNMAKPKTETVLCALADRTCPFQGKEFAWCLTCPHISEEDRNLVKKAVSEPKTGEWVEDGSIEKCNQCGEPRDFLHWKYCPNCGARMKGENHE